MSRLEVEVDAHVELDVEVDDGVDIDDAAGTALASAPAHAPPMPPMPPCPHACKHVSPRPNTNGSNLTGRIGVPGEEWRDER